MRADEVTYYSGAVKPFQCLGEGWRLIKQDYWLFFGLSFVAKFLGDAVPLGLLLGPMMCGLHLCLLRQQRGKRVSFEVLFKGFDYFIPGLIATMIWVVPMVFVVVILYVLLVVGGIALGMGGGPPGPDAVWFLLGGMAAFYAAIFGLILLVNVLTIFIYPLIVDKNLSGWDAVRLSMRGAFSNLGGVLGIVLLEGLIILGGVLMCIFGVYFVLPLTYAMTALAYRQVFPPEPERYEEDDVPESEERAPTNRGDTGIRAMD